jgi:hypothetical protein
MGRAGMTSPVIFVDVDAILIAGILVRGRVDSAVNPGIFILFSL